MIVVAFMAVFAPVVAFSQAPALAPCAVECCTSPSAAWFVKRTDRMRVLRIRRVERVGALRCVCRGGGVKPETTDGGQKHGNRVFIFGMGYTSLALANSLKKQGWDVVGTCRSEEKREALELRGFQTHRFNPDNDGEWLQGEAIRDLHASTHIVNSIPPVGDFDCDPVLASVKVELQQAARERLQWIGYLSSTSVYGDWQGNWVGEETDPRPVERKAVARWEAEKSWMQFGEETGVCVHVFRLGGIYGPGRSALDTIRQSEQNKKLSTRQQLRGHKRFTSRVHVADICQVIVKTMASRDRARKIYNVVDDDPSPRAKVMAYARGLLLGTSVEHDMEFPEESAGFVSSGHVSEKRVSNQRVKDELQVKLLYPSFRSGLEAIANGLNNPFDQEIR